MRPQKHVFVALAAINVLVACAWIYTIDLPRGLNGLSGLGFALMFGQAGLPGAWIALGRSPAPWRFIFTMIGATAVTRLGQLWASSWPFGSVFLGTTLVTAASFGYLRLVGLRSVLAEPQDGSRPAAAAAAGWQYSLRVLMEWTVAIAVALSLLRTLWLVGGTAVAYALGVGGLMALGQIVVLPWAFLVMLSQGDRGIGTVLLAIGYLVGFIMAFSAGSFGGMFALIAIPAHAAYTLGSLWPVRRAGHRVVWPQAVTRAEP